MRVARGGGTALLGGLAAVLVWGCGSSTSSRGATGGAAGVGGQGAAGMMAAGGMGERCPSVSEDGPKVDPAAQATWSRPFTLKHWVALTGIQGIALTSAVDPQDRFLVTDATSIYTLDDAGTHVLFDKTALAADFGTAEFVIHTIDTAADGTLFVLIERTGEFSKEVYRFAGDGHLHLFADLKTYWQFAERFSVVNSEFLLLPMDSLNCVTRTLVGTLYAAGSPNWDKGCGHEIAAEPSGVFYYLPGCNETPLYAGDANGSYIRLVSTWADVNVPVGSFTEVARAPRGGAIVNALSGFHYFDQGTHVALALSPAIAQVGLAETTQRTDFSYCTHAVGKNDAIFIACDGHAYRLDPTP